MTELEVAFFELLEPEAPAVAAMGETALRCIASTLAATARDAVCGVIPLSDCDAEMRRVLRGSGYPRELAKGAARRMVEYVA